MPNGKVGSSLVPSLTIGGRVFTDISNLIVLCGGPATAARFSTLRRPNGSAGYQITAGKTFRIEAIVIFSGTAASIATYNLLYGDTDVGLDSAAAPTTPVYCGGGATVYTAMVGRGTGGASEQFPQVFHPHFDIPATKYACITVDKAASAVFVYGYER